MYLHPFNNGGSNMGVLTSDQWPVMFTSSGAGALIRHTYTSALARLQPDHRSFHATANQSEASIFRFGVVENCTVWLDGTYSNLVSLRGSDKASYTLMAGDLLTLPTAWTSPGKYSYVLQGWYDVKNARYYLPGEDVPCLIRQRALQCWTMFDYGGRSVQGFFSVGEEMGVLLDDQVCLYDEALAGDADAFGSLLPITCCLVSHDLSFAHDGASVRPYASLVCAEAANGQKMTLSLRAAGGRVASVELLATGEVPCEMQKRISLGRCRHARLELRCDCLGAFTLHMICLAAGK
jgi:hypothetical protein